MPDTTKTFSEVWWDTMPLHVLLGPNMDLQESMRLLSENSVLDETFVSSHPEFQWCPEAILRRPLLSQTTPTLLKIDWSQVASTPEIEWDMQRLSREAHVSVRDLKRFPLLDWDFEELSRNLSLTWAHIQAFPEKSWDYERLLRNPMPVWREAWLQEQAQREEEGCWKRICSFARRWCYK
jgi:hypothetical protein